MWEAWAEQLSCGHIVTHHLGWSIFREIHLYICKAQKSLYKKPIIEPKVKRVFFQTRSYMYLIIEVGFVKVQ